MVQCGGDVLPGDRIGTGNLLPCDVAKCIGEILRWSKPTIFLGGGNFTLFPQLLLNLINLYQKGGYNNPNTSRYWTYLTAEICGVDLSDEIPEHEHFLDYGPGYELHITNSQIHDNNQTTELDKIIHIIDGKCS